jgi:DNA-binding transcriptional LysR family regulator
VALTDAGRLLQPYAERVVTELRQLGLALQGSSSASRSTLTIAATPVIATCLLPKVVAEFARKHPEVRIQVMDGSLDTVRQAVLEGHANMGMAFCETCRRPAQRIGVPIPAHEHQPGREAAQQTYPEPQHGNLWMACP